MQNNNIEQDRLSLADWIQDTEWADAWNKKTSYDNSDAKKLAWEKKYHTCYNKMYALWNSVCDAAMKAYCDYYNNGAAIEKAKELSEEDKAGVEAATAGEMAEQATATSNTQSAINAGVNKAAAGMLGTSNASGTSNTTSNNMYGMLANQNAQTQADYLSKLGQAVGNECMACNMNKANYLNTFAALLGA